MDIKEKDRLIKTGSYFHFEYKGQKYRGLFGEEYDLWNSGYFLYLWKGYPGFYRKRKRRFLFWVKEYGPQIPYVRYDDKVRLFAGGFSLNSVGMNLRVWINHEPFLDPDKLKAYACLQLDLLEKEQETVKKEQERLKNAEFPTHI